MTFDLIKILPILPEITLCFSAIAVLLISLIGKEGCFKLPIYIGSLTMFAVAGLLVCPDAKSSISFFTNDAFIAFSKMLVLVSAAVTLPFSLRYAEKYNMAKGEYASIIMFAILGMMLMLSANNLLVLYMGIELQSLPLYALAALQRDKQKSSEAGLKYYILGAFSSALLLYGISLIYGYSGSLNLQQVAHLPEGSMTGMTFGIVMLICGLAFKISAVPFHMWAPDVYDGAPTPVVAFFAVAPKLTALTVIAHLIAVQFASLAGIWQQIILVLSVASMVVGSVAAIRQVNVKRMLAFSSINHVGYALVGLLVGGKEGFSSFLVYLTIYAIMNLGTFAFILLFEAKHEALEKISDFAGLGKKYPRYAIAGAVLMFSMAGLPPFVGFFAKLLIFKAAIDAGMIVLATIGVVSSVIAAYFYLNIVKVMYFDVTDEVIEKVKSCWLSFVTYSSAIAMIVFVIFPAPILSLVKTAVGAIIK